MERSLLKKEFIERFGFVEGENRWLKYEPLMSRSCSLEKYKLRYGEKEGLEKWEDHKTKMKLRGTKEYYLQKFGEEGLKKYFEKNKRLSVSESALKLSNKTDEEILKIREVHKTKSVITEKKYIEKFGEIEGKSRYKELCIKKGVNGIWSLNYWLQKCNNNLELAKQCLYEQQKRDLNFFVKLYGEIEGREKYESYVSRKTKKWLCKTSNSKGQLELEGFIRNCVSKALVYGHNERWALFLDKYEIKEIGQKVIYPDIVLINDEKKAIIDFHGIYWHCHISLFPDENSFHPYKHMQVKELRRIDALKKKFIEKRQIKYFVIWENDWKENRTEIEKHLKELVNEIEI